MSDLLLTPHESDDYGEPFWERFPIPYAGVDEVGRGCLAGPVVAGAVILPSSYDLPGLNDSKKLTAKKRLQLECGVKEQAVAWSLGVVWPKEIDSINILQATLKAMCIALETLKVAPVFLAVDGNQPLKLTTPQQTVKGGDALVPAISAASIVAKTFRDRLMQSLDKRYAGYGFAKHKGYGTKVHLEALRRLGPTRMHRLSFKGVLPEKAALKQERSLWLPGI